MNINWFSNSPLAATGYGNQTKIFVPRLAKLGHRMSISAFFGLQGGPTMWQDGIPIYPNGRHPYGQDVMGAHAVYAGADVIISLLDIWVVNPRLPMPWYPWYPIDHEPIPAPVRDIARQATKGIVMSKFGQRMAQAAGLDCYYVPHGIDSTAYYVQDRTASREMLKWPMEKFVVVMVAANKGYPPRKSFFEQIAAFAAFHRARPDTMLYLHTDDGTHGGETVDLAAYCQVMGLKVGYPTVDTIPACDVLFADQYVNLMGYPDEYMRAVYNAADVKMLVSLGEGFGIPLVEAQMCGCPVITGAWTSMEELCFSGWSIPKAEADPVWTPPMRAFQWRVRPEAVVARLLAAYEVRGNQDYRDRAHAGAMAYNADKVAEKYWKPVLEDIESHLLLPAGQLEASC